MIRADYEELKWKPDRQQKNITNYVMFDKCMEWLTNHSEAFQELLPKLDYCIRSSIGCSEYLLRNYKDQMSAKVNLSAGGSEGIYVDVWFQYGNGNSCKVGTAKTLDEGLDAYAYMGTLAGLFQCVMEAFLFINWDQIPEIPIPDHPKAGKR